MRNKKTLSIQNDVLEKGQRKADEMFSGNFSMYVTYLINQDIKGLVTQPYRVEFSKPVEDIKHKEEIACAIDSILGDD
ncbi:MAG: hypothetical protein AB6733_18335 [Clostridiaceae bacterium]